MRGRRVAHALVTVVLATGAITAVESVSAAPSAVAAESPEDFRSPTTVDLLSRGAKPRDRLRLASAAGSTVVGALRHDIASKQTVSGIEEPTGPQTVTADRRTTVMSVGRDGVRTISFTYENASAPELNGFGGTYAVTDRGFEGNVKLAYPAGTDTETQGALQQLETQFSTLSAAFPYAAVGVGARWKVTRRFSGDGLAFTHSVVYELVERDDNHIVLRSKVRQTAPEQPVDLSGIPDTATATLVASEGVGAGDLDLDLNEVLPIVATVLSRVDDVIQIEQGAQQIRIAETVTTNISITSARSGA